MFSKQRRHCLLRHVTLLAAIYAGCSLQCVPKLYPRNRVRVNYAAVDIRLRDIFAITDGNLETEVNFVIFS